ncbi:MAG: hypothetical protein J2P31_21395, partial [Blastocatellia bacterium]|nr:hypothetical protein [Blastocatellia bacterium]
QINSATQAKPEPAATPAPPGRRASAGRQPASFTIEVCDVSGLLPVEGLCTHTHRQRFQLGKEPTTYCSADKHLKN